MKRILVVGLLLGACGEDAAPFVDANVVDDIDADNSCVKLWDVNADSGASAQIPGGVMLLSASNITDDSAIEVTQAGLTGDFDVSFTFNAFTAGGAGSFLQAAISADVPSPPRKLTAAIGTFPTVGVSAADQPSGTADLQATALTSGTLSFVRAGDQVTITATTGDQTATVTATYSLQPLQIGVQLGSNNGTIAPATSVSIGAFTVASGTGVTADGFDCNSLKP